MGKHRFPTPAAEPVVERPTSLPVLLAVTAVLVVAVVGASALLGPVSAPEFFFTYALIQGAIFLGLIYLADIYEREPIGIVGLLIAWGATGACLIALPLNQFVDGLLTDDVAVVFGAAISAPLVEETAKGAALVIAFLASTLLARRLGTHAFEGVVDGIVYGAAVGMGFSFTEDVFYFLNTAGVEGLDGAYEVFATRVDFFGFNMLGHSVYSALFGAGLGAATVLARRRWKLVAAGAGLFTAMLAHAIHNGLTEVVLVANHGLGTVADAFMGEDLSDETLFALGDTLSDAQEVTDFFDVAFLVVCVMGAALWVRREQRMIARELATEDPEVADPAQVHLVVHYGKRLVAYAGMLAGGRTEEWQLSKVVTDALVDLAFLKRRVREGRAEIVAVDDQRQLAAWAQAALRANREGAGGGSGELLVLTDQALRSSRYELAESLLDVRAGMVAPDEVTRGRLAVAAGRQLAEHGHRFTDAAAQYARAVACFDRALARAAGDPAVLGHRAGALFRHGEAQAAVGNIDNAMISYRGAIASATAAAQADPEQTEAQRNRAAALMRLGEAEASLLHFEEAIAAFEEAVAAVGVTLALQPDDARAHNIGCLAQLGLGEALAATGRSNEAAGSFQRAIAAGTAAAGLVPDFAYAKVNIGLAHLRLAELALAGNDAPTAVEDAYTRALSHFDAVLAGAPGYVKALAARGLARAGLARFRLATGAVGEAEAAAVAALDDCDRALALAPGLLAAHRQRADAFLVRAEVAAARGDAEAARQARAGALGDCDAVLALAPADSGAAALRQRATDTAGR